MAVLALLWLVIGPTLSGEEGQSPTALPTAATTVDRAPATAGEPSPAPTTDPLSGLRWVSLTDLPREARATLDLIRAGGPYPYPRNDNQAFLNREGLLPSRPRGYYREFTVPTPGSADRGARRIVTGAGGERYWTDDHYRSFARVREAS